MPRPSSGRLNAMTHLSSFNRSFNPVAKARRHHRHLMRKDPSLASAISGAGMVLPDGSVALALSDGDIALYEVHVIVRHYCRPARSRGPAAKWRSTESPTSTPASEGPLSSIPTFSAASPRLPPQF